MMHRGLKITQSITFESGEFEFDVVTMLISEKMSEPCTQQQGYSTLHCAVCDYIYGNTAYKFEESSAVKLYRKLNNKSKYL